MYQLIGGFASPFQLSVCGSRQRNPLIWNGSNVVDANSLFNTHVPTPLNVVALLNVGRCVVASDIHLANDCRLRFHIVIPASIFFSTSFATIIQRRIDVHNRFVVDYVLVARSPSSTLVVLTHHSFQSIAYL